MRRLPDGFPGYVHKRSVWSDWKAFGERHRSEPAAAAAASPAAIAAAVAPSAPLAVPAAVAAVHVVWLSQPVPATSPFESLSVHVEHARCVQIRRAEECRGDDVVERGADLRTTRWAPG